MTRRACAAMSARPAQRPIFHTKGMFGRAVMGEAGFGGLLVLNPSLGFWNSFLKGGKRGGIAHNTCLQTVWR